MSAAAAPASGLNTAGTQTPKETPRPWNAPIGSSLVILACNGSEIETKDPQDEKDLKEWRGEEKSASDSSPAISLNEYEKQKKKRRELLMRKQERIERRKAALEELLRAPWKPFSSRPNNSTTLAKHEGHIIKQMEGWDSPVDGRKFRDIDFYYKTGDSLDRWARVSVDMAVHETLSDELVRSWVEQGLRRSHRLSMSFTLNLFRRHGTNEAEEDRLFSPIVTPEEIAVLEIAQQQIQDKKLHLKRLLAETAKLKEQAESLHQQSKVAAWIQIGDGLLTGGKVVDGRAAEAHAQELKAPADSISERLQELDKECLEAMAALEDDLGECALKCSEFRWIMSLLNIRQDDDAKSKAELESELGFLVSAKMMIRAGVYNLAIEKASTSQTIFYSMGRYLQQSHKFGMLSRFAFSLSKKIGLARSLKQGWKLAKAVGRGLVWAAKGAFKLFAWALKAATAVVSAAVALLRALGRKIMGKSKGGYDRNALKKEMRSRAKDNKSVKKDKAKKTKSAEAKQKSKKIWKKRLKGFVNRAVGVLMGVVALLNNPTTSQVVEACDETHKRIMTYVEALDRMSNDALAISKELHELAKPWTWEIQPLPHPALEIIEPPGGSLEMKGPSSGITVALKSTGRLVIDMELAKPVPIAYKETTHQQNGIPQSGKAAQYVIFRESCSRASLANFHAKKLVAGALEPASLYWLQDRKRWTVLPSEFVAHLPDDPKAFSSARMRFGSEAIIKSYFRDVRYVPTVKDDLESICKIIYCWRHPERYRELMQKQLPQDSKDDVVSVQADQVLEEAQNEEDAAAGGDSVGDAQDAKEPDTDGQGEEAEPAEADLTEDLQDDPDDDDYGADISDEQLELFHEILNGPTPEDESEYSDNHRWLLDFWRQAEKTDAAFADLLKIARSDPDEPFGTHRDLLKAIVKKC